MPDYVEKKKPARGENGIFFWKEEMRTILGKIITENRNIFTTVPHPGYGASTIGHLFGKPDKYMPDPYEGRKEIERVERIIFYLFIKVVE